jgi:hypothetical protein
MRRPSPVWPGEREEIPTGQYVDIDGLIGVKVNVELFPGDLVYVGRRLEKVTKKVKWGYYLIGNHMAKDRTVPEPQPKKNLDIFHMRRKPVVAKEPVPEKPVREKKEFVPSVKLPNLAEVYKELTSAHNPSMIQNKVSVKATTAPTTSFPMNVSQDKKSL